MAQTCLRCINAYNNNIVVINTLCSALDHLQSMALLTERVGRRIGTLRRNIGLAEIERWPTEMNRFMTIH